MVRLIEKEVLAPLHVAGLHVTGFKYIVEHAQQPASRSWLVTVSGCGTPARREALHERITKGINRLFPGEQLHVRVIE